jgi:hypothetical protein
MPHVCAPGRNSAPNDLVPARASGLPEMLTVIEQRHSSRRHRSPTSAYRPLAATRASRPLLAATWPLTRRPPPESTAYRSARNALTARRRWLPDGRPAVRPRRSCGPRADLLIADATDAPGWFLSARTPARSRNITPARSRTNRSVRSWMTRAACVRNPLTSERSGAPRRGSVQTGPLRTASTVRACTSKGFSIGSQGLDDTN